jgi:hypothetical protein
LISHVVTIGFARLAPVPANATVTKISESSPWPTTVEPIVRDQSQRPCVATFIRASTVAFANSPTR